MRWLFDHQERANGMDLEVAIAPVRYAELAVAFERVTGHRARYIDTSLDDYFGGALKAMAERPAGYSADPDDPATMSFRDNFTGFWNMWKHDIIARDYALLDEIHPNRIRSVEQWLRRADQLSREAGRGGLWEQVQPENLPKHPVLKIGEDQRRDKS